MNHTVITLWYCSNNIVKIRVHLCKINNYTAQLRCFLVTMNFKIIERFFVNLIVVHCCVLAGCPALNNGALLKAVINLKRVIESEKELTTTTKPVYNRTSPFIQVCRLN